MTRRWLKLGLLGFAALLLAALLALFWLLGTGAGLRHALDRAADAADGRLTYDRAEGSLFGGLRVRGLRYVDPEVGHYRIDELEISPRSGRLLGGELYLAEVRVHGVDLTLPAGADDETDIDDAAFELPELPAPIALRLERLHIDGFVLRQHDRTPLLRLDHVEAAGLWRGTRIELEHFEASAEEGEVSLHAKTDTGADWTGEAQVDFDWQLPDREQRLAGRLHMAGPQHRPSLHLDLTQPSPTRLELSWDGIGTAATWQLHTHSEGFDLGAVLEQAPVQSLVLDLEARGTSDRAELTGHLAVDGYALQIERLAGRYRDQQLHVEHASIAEVDGSGRLELTADLDLSSETPTGEVQANWSGINPPLPAPFEQLDASGRIMATGSLEFIHAEVELNARADDRPLRLELRAEGDPRNEIRFAPLIVYTDQGRLEADGQLSLVEELAWQAQVRGRGFDPGLLLPDWPGQVELDASVAGRYADETVHLRLDLNRLGGTLRQRPLAGTGHVELAGNDEIRADLQLRLGDNRVAMDGRLGAHNDIDIRFELAEPGLLLDEITGQVDGEMHLEGQWPAMAIAGHVEASALSYGSVQAGRLRMDVDGRGDFATPLNLRIDAADLVIAGEPVTRLRVDGSGDAQANRVRVRADAERGTLELELAGRYHAENEAWSGRIERLDLAAPELALALHLRETADLRLSPDELELERTCLDGAPGSLCVEAEWQADGKAELGLDLRRVPLAWLPGLGADAMVLATGELGGSARLRLDEGAFTGQATIEGTPGSLRMYGDDEDLLSWSRLSGTLELDGNQRTLEAILELSPSGRVLARVSTDPDPELDGSTRLDGEIALDLDELRWLELLVPEMVGPAGELRGRLRLGGTVDLPDIDGEIALRAFSAELPAAGLRLRDSTLNLRGGRGNRIDVDGRFTTAPDSTLVVDGWFGLPEGGRLPMDLRITGDRVLVADLPVARVFVSPDLRVDADADRLNVTGELLIPQARIMPESIEGGVVRASPDIRIVDPDNDDLDDQADGAALPLHANVLVRLGERVSVEGYGLQGQLSGQLEITERPGRSTTGRGEILVSGNYQAYGQDLEIERGRLIFTRSPLDNPLLDIRAVRRVGNVIAGLAVTGNVHRPVLEVYSVPAMDQAEALSYLVLGRPLRQATSSADQDALGAAATAVTTAGGDLLARSLGARLGLDDVGVGTSRELGAGALTLGKYLSPRLYLGYGRSLFDGGQLVFLRYRLTDRIELEAQSGTRENKAGINYRLER